jgi:hypothetical protein
MSPGKGGGIVDRLEAKGCGRSDGAHTPSVGPVTEVERVGFSLDVNACDPSDSFARLSLVRQFRGLEEKIPLCSMGHST